MDDRAFGSISYFGGFTLDSVRRTLYSAERAVALRPRCFDVLCLLVDHAGRVVTKDEFFDAAWPGVVVTEDSLTRCISEIRAALQDADQSIVKTVPRRGYVLVVPVGTAAAAQPSSGQTVLRGVPAAGPGVGRPRLATRIAWIAAPLVVCAGVLWGVVLLNTPAGGDAAVGRGTAPALSGGAAPAPRLSIVVLPLTSVGAADQAFFAEAVTDDLTTDMSRIPGSYVIARSSAYSYAATPRDIRRIGAELGVRYALAGSVQRIGEEVRLNVQLIDAESGREIWAERFDGSRKDLPRLERQVTGTIARTLHLELMKAESVRGSRSLHPGAEDLALQAWSLYQRRTAEDVAASRALLERSLAQDPNAAFAWSLLSDTYTTDVLNRWLHLRDATRGDWVRRAQEAADKAMAIDPDNLYVVGSHATVLQLQGKPEQALAMFERQIVLNRNYAPAWHRISYTHVTLGEPDKALAAGAEAIRLSPRDGHLYSFYVVMAAAHLHAGRDADALLWARRATGQKPKFGTAYAWIAAAAAHLGDMDTAQRAIAEFKRLQPGFVISSFRAEKLSDHPAYLRQRERFYDGLRKAGLGD